MNTPDPRLHGLDSAHILGIINQATGSPRGNAARAAVGANGVRVRLLSSSAAREAASALRRIGYQVIRTNRPRDRGVLVTGWSAGALEARLDIMRVVIHQLSISPSVTASAAISRARASSPAPPDDALLAETGARLRAWVAARSGIHAPIDPVLPSDRGIALRLRQTWRLENAIEDLMAVHLRMARDALAVFRSLRPYTSDSQAQETAVEQIGRSPYLDSAWSGRGTVGRSAVPGAPAAPRANRPAPSGPAHLAARGFPQSIHTAVSSTSPARRHPGGRHFPAGHPGPRR